MPDYNQQRRDDRGGPRQDGMPLDFLKIAVEKGIDDKFINAAEKFPSQSKADVTNSQIRSLFGSMKKMQMRGFDNAQLLIFKPRLAYATKRDSKLTDLKEVLILAINAVNDAKDDKTQLERFERFCLGFEAILAYHKAHAKKGGEKS